MATDRKADHFTAADNYRDIDGNMKTFTTIDYDTKTTIGTTKPMVKSEVGKLKDEMKRYKEETILEILAMPAVNALRMDSSGRFESLVHRNEEKGVIEWNESVVRAMLDINDDLRRTVSLLLWRTTVKEEHWFDSIREDHKAMLRGDWKKLI